MAKEIRRFDPRQVMNGESFEIFHYLDTKTHYLDAHFHDFYEIFCFIGGDVDYWIEGSLYHLKPGDILLINPTKLHKPVAREETEKYERIVLWINKKYLSFIEGGVFEKCFFDAINTGNLILRPSTSEKNQVLSLANRFVDEFYGNDFLSKSCAYGMLLEFMTLINRIALNSESLSIKDTTPTFIADILAYIGQNYDKKLSLDELASKFFISKYYLLHEFKKAVGTSVHRYITLKRLGMAYNLLNEGVQPNQVSAMCGFSDYTSFFRAFKNEYGISPAQVKNQ